VIGILVHHLHSVAFLDAYVIIGIIAKKIAKHIMAEDKLGGI
jgi:hypothetical protein